MMAKTGGAVKDEALAFSQEISRSAEASLNPLQEDLAEWLSRVLGVGIPADKFMDSLSNGVLVCKLAQLIQNKAVECHRLGKNVKELPQKKIKCFGNASSESFFARDNVANFLSWCRSIGLEDTCLFETEGLVLKKDQRNVLVCIYELARVAGHYGIEPPGLVKLEKEIAKEEKNPRPKSSVTPNKKSKRSLLDQECNNNHPEVTNHNQILRIESPPIIPSPPPCPPLPSRPPIPPPPPPLPILPQTPPPQSIPMDEDTNIPSVIIPSPTESVDAVHFPSPCSPVSSIEFDYSNPYPLETVDGLLPPSPAQSVESTDDSSSSSRVHSIETIDSVGIESSSRRTSKKTKPQRRRRKVQSVVKTCEFPLEIQRISEGRYNIGGKVVFIRMLRGRHVMVRVGGGWDTLQHFLMRHDEVKVDKKNRNSIVSLDGDSVPDQFYVVHQAKYKGKGEA